MAAVSGGVADAPDLTVSDLIVLPSPSTNVTTYLEGVRVASAGVTSGRVYFVGSGSSPLPRVICLNRAKYPVTLGS